MARDGSGNYSLPAGNPVVTGTTIDASWANDTMDDIKTEIQDSLSRSGKGGMLVAFKNADGTVSAPGITFTNETTSGMYRAGTNDLRISVAGVDRVQFRTDATDPVRIWSDGAWATMLHANSDVTITGTWTIPEASVTAHEAALTILESQITDGSLLARVGGTETITGVWTFSAEPVFTAGIQLNDSDVITLGTGNDVTIQFDATDFIIASDASIILQSITGTEKLLEANLNSSVDLYYDNAIGLQSASYTANDGGTGANVQDGLGTLRPVGMNIMPIYEIDAADSFDLAHNGMLWHTDGASTIAFTCDNDAAIPVGATYVVVNESSTGTQTIEEGVGVTLRWFDGFTTGGQTGDRTLALGGVATVVKYTDTEFFIWGVGLS